MQIILSIQNFLTHPMTGSVVGLIGVSLAIYFYVRQNRKTRISTCWTGERLLGTPSKGFPSGITVSYNGVDVPKVTRSIVSIWNSGQNTVNRSDIAMSDHVRLVLSSDATALTASVMKASRDVNLISVELDPDRSNSVLFSFDFLDPMDGATIQILHTGDKLEVKMEGTIRGAANAIQNIGPIYNDIKYIKETKKISSSKNPIIGGYFLIFMSFAVLIGSIILTLNIYEEKKKYSLGFDVGDFMFVTFFILMTIFLFTVGCFIVYYFSRLKRPKSIIIEDDE